MVRVTGTIKKAEEEAIRRARAAILKAKRGSVSGIWDGLEAILGAPNDGRGKDEREEDAMEGLEDDDGEDEDYDSDG